MLEREPGIEIIGEATNGREAVEMCDQLQPDIVLMDVRMPEMDGLSATREIKGRHPTICVLIVTTHENPDYLLEAIRVGAAGYVLKDSSRQRLVSAVRRALDGESPPRPGARRRAVETHDQTGRSTKSIPAPGWRTSQKGTARFAHAPREGGARVAGSWTVE